MRQTFEVPGRLPGMNEYTSANRSNAQAGGRMKSETEEAIMWAAKVAGLKPMAGKVYARFIWVEPNMRRDLDNIAFAKKFVFDALQKMGVIKNDNWSGVTGFSDTFRLNKANPRVIVELEEI